MNQRDRALLERLMERMAGGDFAAAIELLDTSGNRIRGTVVHIVRETGRKDVLTDEEAIDHLTMGAVMVLFDHAGSWNPTGALPWTWAYRAIASYVSGEIGHATAGTDEDLESEASDATGHRSTVDPGLELLLAMAETDDTVALLVELVYSRLSRQQAEVLLEFQLLKSMNCVAAAQTVGDMYGMSADNVRQTKLRAMRKIQPALADPRYAPLAHLPLLAA